jgi:hypothetical protein
MKKFEYKKGQKIGRVFQVDTNLDSGKIPKKTDKKSRTSIQMWIFRAFILF